MAGGDCEYDEQRINSFSGPQWSVTTSKQRVASPPLSFSSPPSLFRSGYVSEMCLLKAILLSTCKKKKCDWGTLVPRINVENAIKLGFLLE
jgi:hypothetical protein